MRMITPVVVLTTLVLSCVSANAQPRLKIGQRLPDLVFPHVLNYQRDSLSLSLFRSKLIILEFWNPSCSNCLHAFASLDSLQLAFSSQVQIILVNKESPDSILHFFAKHPKIYQPKLVMITGDRSLAALLPHEGFPYSAWIDSGGVIRYFSDSYDVNAERVQAFIQRKQLHMRNVNVPVFNGNLFEIEKKAGITSPLYYCYISRCMEGLDVSNNEQAEINDSTIRTSATCQSIVELYKKAYREYRRYKFNLPESIVLCVTDSSRYIRPAVHDEQGRWAAANSYNFDMIVPLSRKEETYRIMQQALYSYFGLKVTIYKKKVGDRMIDVLQLQE
jgi:thiol-disulfide isomerase/thioredoxin